MFLSSWLGLGLMLLALIRSSISKECYGCDEDASCEKVQCDDLCLKIIENGKDRKEKLRVCAEKSFVEMMVGEGNTGKCVKDVSRDKVFHAITNSVSKEPQPQPTPKSDDMSRTGKAKGRITITGDKSMTFTVCSCEENLCNNDDLGKSGNAESGMYSISGSLIWSSSIAISLMGWNLLGF